MQKVRRIRHSPDLDALNRSDPGRGHAQARRAGDGVLPDRHRRCAGTCWRSAASSEKLPMIRLHDRIVPRIAPKARRSAPSDPCGREGAWHHALARIRQSHSRGRCVATIARSPRHIAATIDFRQAIVIKNLSGSSQSASGDSFWDEARAASQKNCPAVDPPARDVFQPSFSNISESLGSLFLSWEEHPRFSPHGPHFPDNGARKRRAPARPSVSRIYYGNKANNRHR